MKVIWRQNGKDWQVAAGHPYKDETHLHTFLMQNPNLIPFEDVSKDILPPAVMIHEFGLPGSGSSDIVGVDEQGGITVIECKLATNPEVKRKVIGQVLEYAAFLWERPYAEFDTMAQRRLGKPLVQAVQERLEEESREDWNGDDFIGSVTRTLETGNFRLVIAVDSVSNELRRTIEYLAQGPSRLAIYALEVGYFSSGQSEILVPHLHGFKPDTVVPPISTQWTRERFFEDVRQRKLPENTVETIQVLLEFCEEQASRVFWGMGKQTGSFTFHYLKDARSYSMFSVYTDGKLAINFGWLREAVPPNLLTAFWKSLQEIDGMSEMHVREDFKSWPSVKIGEVCRTPEDIAKFKQSVLSFRDQIANL